MGIVVGGEKAWKIFNHGDVVASLHWIDKKPSIVLFPKRPMIGAVPFVVPIGLAHQYAKANGDPEAMNLVPMSVDAAKSMGFDVSPFICKQIADAVFEHIQDLLGMPPEPNWQHKAVDDAVGELVIKVDGDVVKETEVSMPEGV